jgi:HEAT repeat protein
MNVELLHVRGDTQGLIQALSAGSDPLMRTMAAEHLGELRDTAAIGPLIDSLDDPSGPVRDAAAAALVRFGDAAVEAVLAALGDPSAEKRSYAAGILGRIGSPRAVVGLVAKMDDKSQDVRCYVAGSLAELGPAAVDALILALRDERADVRRLAALTLGRIRDERAITPLIGALADPEPDVLSAAAGSLVAMGDAVVAPVAQKLRSGGTAERYYTAELLGILGGPDARAALEVAKTDPDPNVRRAVEGALHRLDED